MNCAICNERKWDVHHVAVDVIKSEVISVLEELEKKAGWYSQNFNEAARNSDMEDTLVALSAIQKVKERYL